MFYIGGGPVSWSAKCQKTVATSMTETEYMAVLRAVQQAI